MLHPSIAIVILFAITVFGQSTTKSYPGLSSSNINEFQLNGQAASINPNSDNTFRLTTSGPNQGGSIYLKQAVALTGPNGFKASFSTVFSFSMPQPGGIGDEDGAGADGLVFVVNAISNTVGSVGGGMGYSGVTNSVGIEFDTYNNGEVSGNHIGIDLNGDINSVQAQNYGTRMNSGTVFYAWVEFNGDTKLLEVRISTTSTRPTNAFMSRTVDLVSILGSSSVYVGFSAATGSGYNVHQIHTWVFTNTYVIISQCGNAILESGEVCDGGACCKSDCSGYLTVGTTCRASAGPCDVAETCTGSSQNCPVEGFLGSATVCRSSNGVCDVAETCTGSSASCPADSFQSSTTTCRTSGGDCDVAEQCTGSSANCPADSFKSSATTCRASNGACDVAETCTGSSASCPANSFQSSTTTCRASNGICDVAEQCTGSSAACPADSFQVGTVCRTSAGDCDVDETCSGSSASCPADSFQSSSVTCRASNGICDVAEQCTGSSVACPADSFQSSTSTCRASNGDCDVAEQCTGSSASCPVDSFQSSATTCRNSNGPCDVAEQCTGSTASCPVDSFQSSSVTCRASNGICDVDEQCTGSSAGCPVDSFQFGTTCRPAAGDCDVDETCSGSSASCPADTFRPSTVTCRGVNGDCDVVEQCTGSSASCPADSFQSSTTTCRTSNGDCDVAEQCTGSSASCPVDSFQSPTTTCRASNGICDVAEQCTGSSASCPTDLFQLGTTCRTSAGVCDVDETCDGTSAACPTNGFANSSRICRDSIGPCDPAEHCSGFAVACPVDVIGSFETDCIGLNFVVPGQTTSFLNYDVISFNGLVAERGNIEGRIAVKNNINVGDGWSVGFSTGKSNTDQQLTYAVVAGGDVNWLSGEIYPHHEAYPNGPQWTENMFVGGTFSGASYLADRVTGTCASANCLAAEFDDVQACYGAYQNAFASKPDNVQKVIQWSGLTITCNSANSLTYFVTITPSEMSQYTYVVLDSCNTNARWVVNVPTTDNVLLTGVSIIAQPEAVVYNIQGSGRTITINGIYVEGSIIAPYNTLYQNGGIVKGRVIVGDITKSLNFDKVGCFTPSTNAPSK